MLFKGEQDHLLPTTSPEFLQCDFFIVAGRIIGQSAAILHLLSGGLDETATITTEDCVDQHVREVIEMVCIYIQYFCLMSKYLSPYVLSRQNIFSQILYTR